MIKNLIIILSLILLLTGCGNVGEQEPASENLLPSEDLTLSIDEAQYDDELENDEMEVQELNENIYRPEKTFVNSTDSTIEVLDALTDARGYPKTSDLGIENSESTAAEDKTYNMRTITIGDGAYIYLSETIDDGVLFSIMCYGEIEKMSDETFEQFDYYMLALINLLGDDLEGLVNELSLDTTEGLMTNAKSQYADFSYMVANSNIIFSINPV